MNYAQLLEDIKHEVTRFFQERGNENCVYHSIDHTENVVSKTVEIANHYKLTDPDFFSVSAAAWFHDTGYNTGPAPQHEERGAQIATDFLKKNGLAEEIIAQVAGCIMATKLPQQPQNLLEQIVCDADLYHLGTDRFTELNKKMRKEGEWHFGQKIDKHVWRDGTLSLLQSHQYHTDYAQNLLEAKKQENISRLKMKEAEKDNETRVIKKKEMEVPDANKKGDEKKDKDDRPNRGIETMFRISSNNHQRLSDMADNKANIMITTTSIILSVLLSVMLRKLEDNPQLVFPTLLLLAVCVVTMVFSILATRPSLPDGRFTQQNITEKSVNLLFFGNFYRMSYEEYRQGMEAMMNDRDFLYGSLTRDVYSQGIVLGRKYRLLRIGYNVFMFGIIASVLAFVIAAIFFPN